ncbi:MAG: hypothetical protein ACI8RU_001339 [Zhongshania aliphaticivorans]|jgi:hypothetical protein|uniref:DUF2971 domain-containing protein n=1 Tax=Zhongshania aliphaticivorans TaxID=1470434 RepID=UPI0039E61A15
MQDNYINFTKAELTKPIYRIMPVHRLLGAFEQKSMALVEPEKWDDPFENLLLKGFIQHSSADAIGSNLFRNSIYGQCWTFHRETDAMWRIYSPDKQGVKVRTTIGKLISALISSSDKGKERACFIGKVSYLSQRELVSKLIGISGMHGRYAAESLLYKRKEFRHEREVRLIYAMNSLDGNVHEFNIDPIQLFDEVVFDPRMNNHIFHAYKDAVHAKGFRKPIRQSVMYQLPTDLKNIFT